MILKALREGLGRIIVFINFIFLPKQIKRSEAEQNKVDKLAKKYALYQFYACPFCTKTRRAIYRLNIPIEFVDAQKDKQNRADLLAGGGEIKVPCLRIKEDGESKWMYESNDIIKYLNSKFS